MSKKREGASLQPSFESDFCGAYLAPIRGGGMHDWVLGNDRGVMSPCPRTTRPPPVRGGPGGGCRGSWFTGGVVEGVVVVQGVMVVQGVVMVQGVMSVEGVVVKGLVAQGVSWCMGWWPKGS